MNQNFNDLTHEKFSQLVIAGINDSSSKEPVIKAKSSAIRNHHCWEFQTFAKEKMCRF